MESADAVGAAALDVAAVDVAAAPLGLVLEFRLVAPATVVEIKCSHVGFVFLSAFAALAMCLKGPKSHQKKKINEEYWKNTKSRTALKQKLTEK